jgi:hypothetical protein
LIDYPSRRVEVAGGQHHRAYMNRHCDELEDWAEIADRLQ